MGFDAAVEFAPDWSCQGKQLMRGHLYKVLSKLLRVKKAAFDNQLFSYNELVDRMLDKPGVDYERFRCVTPMWDNSARRKMDATIFVGSTPEKYEYWLKQVCISTASSGRQQLVFINAWNEWAEGNHLEPCRKWGRQYLEATLRALEAVPTIDVPTVPT